MSQQYRYPSSASVTVAAVGANLAPIPTSSILVAGENPSNNLKPLQTTAGGLLKVDVSGSAPPTGSATAANQVLEIAELTAIDAKLPATLGQKLMAASLAVAIASDQSAIPVSAASLPLPSGAATEATLLAFSAKSAASLTPTAYDYIETTYRSGSPGMGQIDQVIYKSGGSGGTTVRTLTMAYDGSDRLSTVTAT